MQLRGACLNCRGASSSVYHLAVLGNNVDSPHSTTIGTVNPHDMFRARNLSGGGG